MQSSMALTLLSDVYSNSASSDLSYDYLSIPDNVDFRSCLFEELSTIKRISLLHRVCRSGFVSRANTMNSAFFSSSISLVILATLWSFVFVPYLILNYLRCFFGLRSSLRLIST